VSSRYPVGDPEAREAAVEAATLAIRRGQLIVLPTDTVYGIAADPLRPGATGRLFEAKGRPAGVQLPVFVDSLEQADAVGVVDERARALAARFWPGGLTLVVASRPGVDLELGGDGSSVGLRCPDHPVPRRLCAEIGPLAATSANLHGEPTPETAAEVADLFGKAVAVVVDGGRCAGAPSTVVDCTGADLVLLREGVVPWSDVLGVTD
jgi:tRNA threonylcarbamoyl adenosine modification protein (Sua5/YciO/YrdC/YwlC family)